MGRLPNRPLYQIEYLMIRADGYNNYIIALAAVLDLIIIIFYLAYN